MLLNLSSKFLENTSPKCKYETKIQALVKVPLAINMEEAHLDLEHVCILALDALEYHLVEEYDLKAVKQKEYGKIDVSTFKDLARQSSGHPSSLVYRRKNTV